MEKKEYETMFSVEDDFWWYRGLHELVIRFVRSENPQTIKIGRILDAGCGTGRMMQLLQPYGTVEGIDVSPEALRFCAERGLRSVSLHDLSAWRSGPGVYDVIISLDVLYHEEIFDEDVVLKEFYRALKPGGTLIVNLPAFEFLRRGHDNAVHTRKRYTLQKTIALYKSLGFIMSRATYRLPHLFPIMAGKKLLERLSGAQSAQSDLKRLSRPFNMLLTWCNRLENACITRGITFPFGTSVFIVARK